MNATQLTATGTGIQCATQSASSTVAAGHVADPGNSKSLIEPPPDGPGRHSARAIEQLAPEATERESRRHRWVLSIAGLGVLVLIACGVSKYLEYARSWVKTDNAYLAAHIHSVSSRVAGNVKEVLVQENQLVAAGEVLARLDPRDFEVHTQQARAGLAQAHAQVQEAQARIAQARAQVAREAARAIKARNDRARAAALYEGGSGAISKQEHELARADAEAAEAAVQGAQSALESATASALAAEAQQDMAEANLQEAQLQLSYAELVAPATGRIGKKNLESGNHVQPGQALLALVQNDIWVTGNFKETQLTHLRPGQLAQVRVDAFPGRVFRARVESVSPGSGGQFALLPPDNATGNFTKIVQRVPVKILLEADSLAGLEGRLVPGMSADVMVMVR